jgi:hypothetical protein
MTAQATTTVETVETVTTTETVKPRAKYLVQREGRKRFTFGPAWINAVLGGVVNDKAKLVAHAVKLKVGAENDLKDLTIADLLPKVQEAIYAEPPAETEATA